MCKLDHLLEHLIKPLILLLLDDEEYVVELVLDRAGIHQSWPKGCQIPPVLLLPEKLYPHLVCPRRLVTQTSLVVVAVQMCDVPELLPLVEHLQALNKQSLPSAEVELTDLGVWALSRELSGTHQLLHWPLKVLRVSLSRILVAMLLWILGLILSWTTRTAATLRRTRLLITREQELSR